ncbi:putative RNA-directed DNA polymerase from transposon X-element [Araneus ventricosus]|uniref:Putative RNA-directed DNA polymerase from transposon X-element n=1 Tax=Araneus ventricosus TaxID=182803 RepID=A0A4Y2SXT6_ARAVE|nr:putative RNA-directed DNA polymerase from transposon X-element [Araneus ventricosus]
MNMTFQLVLPPSSKTGVFFQDVNSSLLKEEEICYQATAVSHYSSARLLSGATFLNNLVTCVKAECYRGEDDYLWLLFSWTIRRSPPVSTPPSQLGPSFIETNFSEQLGYLHQSRMFTEGKIIRGYCFLGQFDDLLLFRHHFPSSVHFLSRLTFLNVPEYVSYGGIEAPTVLGLEDYNSTFSYHELKDALRKSNPTSPGPDQIHNNMLKHLGESSLLTILLLFNRIWQERVFPHSWLKAIVVPIPKPGKDKQNPNNYRPIALTSCLSKLLERMVSARLMHVLERSKWFVPSQSGFRGRRNTIDNLLKLETVIREAFVHKKHLVSIFFDIEKAYDRTWRYGILKDLSDIGLKGNLPLFIKLSTDKNLPNSHC